MTGAWDPADESVNNKLKFWHTMRIITDKYMYAWWMIATVQCDHEY